MKRLALLIIALVNITLAQGQIIESSNRSTIGKIKTDGTIENSSGSTLGYIKNDGTIENSHRSTIGYVKKDGTVENSHRSTIGYARGVKKRMGCGCFLLF